MSRLYATIVIDKCWYNPERSLKMKVKKNKSLAARLEKRIMAMPDNVIFRSDIAGLSPDDPQISRALRALINKKLIVRISYGVYAKVEQSKYTGALVLKESLDVIAQKIFDRLHVKWDLTSAQKNYNSGLSTQVPARVSFRLNSRFRRKIGYDGYSVYYEGGIYAR